MKSFSFTEAVDLMKKNSKIEKLLFKDCLSDIFEFGAEGIITKGKQGNQVYFNSWKLGIKENKLFNELKIGIERQGTGKTIESYLNWKKDIKKILEFIDLEKFGFFKIDKGLEVIQDKDIEDLPELDFTYLNESELNLTEDEIKELKSIVSSKEAHIYKKAIKSILGADNYFSFSHQALIYENPKIKDSWIYIKYIKENKEDSLGKFKIHEIKDFQIAEKIDDKRLIGRHKDYGMFYLQAKTGVARYSMEDSIKKFYFSLFSGTFSAVGLIEFKDGSWKFIFDWITFDEDKSEEESLSIFKPFKSVAIEDSSNSKLALIKWRDKPMLIKNTPKSFLCTDLNGKQVIYTISDILGNFRKLEIDDSADYSEMELQTITDKLGGKDAYMSFFIGKNKQNKYDYYYVQSSQKFQNYAPPGKLIKVTTTDSKIDVHSDTLVDCINEDGKPQKWKFWTIGTHFGCGCSITHF